ncbi:MAG: methyl-accepting chemotaxis protein [Polyangiaceae bacterium]
MSQSLQQEVMQACQAQAEKLEVTSKTVGELQTSVTNMARVTEQISERIGVAAQGTQANVAAGLESLAHVERVFAGLRDSVVRLGAIADAIVEVRATSAMVEKLARQTNLLAVNAAIESERAGQSGAAFGVVAEEVRRLAESSRTTSEKISTAVADAAQAVQEIAVTTRAQVDESSAAIVATSADLGKVTASLRDLERTSRESVEALRREEAESKDLSKTIIQFVEDNSRFLSDVLGKLSGQPIIDVTPDQVVHHLDTLQVIDVRRPEEYCDHLGHIRTARLHTIGDGFREALSRYDRHQPTLLVCRSGGRSAQAARIAQSLGFTTVLNLSGGMLRWVEEGKPSVAKNGALPDPRPAFPMPEAQGWGSYLRA